MKDSTYKEKAKTYIDKTKAHWTGLSAKEKQKYSIIGCGVVLLMVVIGLFFGISANGYEVLYPGIDQNEAAQVFATLKESGIAAQINEKGEVTVPKEAKNSILLELAGDFPTTAPNYGVYSNNSGFTATESDRKFYLNAQLQDRLQETLQCLEGVSKAIVNLNIVENDHYVWESNKAQSTASVTLTMKSGKKVTPQHATTVKNLIAGSVPTMLPENVVVIDAATMLEVKSTKDQEIETVYDLQRLDYEAEYERRLVEKVRGLLSSVYGSDGVQAIATVVLDYDRMLTEQMQFVPEDNGTGVKNHITEKYTVGGNQLNGGIIGEENNTDIPTYESMENGDGEYTDIQREIDYNISYVKQQIEKGEALLKKASISVIVNEPNFTAEKQDQLMTIIAKGTNIEPSNISVSNLTYKDTPEIPVSGGTLVDFFDQYKNEILWTIGGLLLLLVVIVLVVINKKKSKNQVLAEEERDAQFREQEEAVERQRMEEQARRRIKEAENQANKENKVTGEIRRFAGENPEITASLIRAWLKEDE